MVEGLRNRKNPISTNEKANLKEVSWREVAKHNTKGDCWIIVDDIAYDLTGYVDKHPGGSELMLTFAGREATYAFRTYHALSKEIAEEKLRYFAIAKVIDSEFPTYPKETPLYDDLVPAVKAYFVDNKIDPKAWFEPFYKFCFMMVIAAVSLYFCYNMEMPAYVNVIGALVFGWIQALPLLHIMHDCSHGSFSHKPFLWDLFGKFTMDMYAGVSMTAWHLQHVVGHHVWTNMFAADPDLPPAEEGDPRYLVKKQKWKALYKFQHIYLPIAYGVLGLKVRISDVTHAFGGEYAGPLRVRKHSPQWYSGWFVVKAAWIMWRVVYPIVFLGVPVAWYLFLFVVSDFITGWYLAFNFQVSHISDVADYPLGDKGDRSDKCEDEWAVSQVKTSVDYSHGDWFMTWLCGALNYQTVHHLFPGVSQYHYPKLAPIIMDVCKKHNVKYNVLPSFTAAFTGHINYLREMGQKGDAASFHMG
eukprot:TRINITY_DN6873_c4_g1_i1.p1 TRINITY_DN6873_c4_g1~~TRINITY_DN6873_c4_g1_i1.p1  ORF type:complete len:472 (+),score=75.60 TRINITY_DN6873_c4_g1_i1:81-1496(+)